MTRFRTTATYAGKAQKHLKARVQKLAELGVDITDRNPEHPHMYSRRAVAAAERALGVEWRDANRTAGAGYVRVN